MQAKNQVGRIIKPTLKKQKKIEKSVNMLIIHLTLILEEDLEGK